MSPGHSLSLIVTSRLQCVERGNRRCDCALLSRPACSWGAQLSVEVRVDGRAAGVAPRRRHVRARVVVGGCSATHGAAPASLRRGVRGSRWRVCGRCDRPNAGSEHAQADRGVAGRAADAAVAAETRHTSSVPTLGGCCWRSHWFVSCVAPACVSCADASCAGASTGGAVLPYI